MSPSRWRQQRQHIGEKSNRRRNQLVNNQFAPSSVVGQTGVARLRRVGRADSQTMCPPLECTPTCDGGQTSVGVPFTGLLCSPIPHSGRFGGLSHHTITNCLVRLCEPWGRCVATVSCGRRSALSEQAAGSVARCLVVSLGCALNGVNSMRCDGLRSRVNDAFLPRGGFSISWLAPTFVAHDPRDARRAATHRHFQDERISGTR
jgi:hypothetical protein